MNILKELDVYEDKYHINPFILAFHFTSEQLAWIQVKVVGLWAGPAWCVLIKLEIFTYLDPILYKCF